MKVFPAPNTILNSLSLGHIDCIRCRKIPLSLSPQQLRICLFNPFSALIRQIPPLKQPPGEKSDCFAVSLVLLLHFCPSSSSSSMAQHKGLCHEARLDCLHAQALESICREKSIKSQRLRRDLIAQLLQPSKKGFPEAKREAGWASGGGAIVTLRQIPSVATVAQPTSQQSGVEEARWSSHTTPTSTPTPGDVPRGWPG